MKDELTNTEMAAAEGDGDHGLGTFILLLRDAGSLQLALVLIGLYIVVLAGATLVEKWFGPDVARAGIYGADWFAAIHLLLAVNVLCAMLVRFPWHWRQTGFLVTHAGILVLLAGCLASKYWGVEGQLSIYEGQAERHVLTDSSDFDLGFQVHLNQFRRKLDPGSETASYYSSLVDFLDLGDPPKKLQENELITLNAPVDFADPVSGRTYRLFQSGFDGPLLPADGEFDRQTGGDRSRDHLYRSVLSVNFDPGRGLKYAGCLMIVVGILLVYLLRGRRPVGMAVALPPQQVADVPSAAKRPNGGALLAFLILTFFAGACRAEDREELDWSPWLRTPVFVEGRIAPLDTFARETVEAICGSVEPTLILKNGTAKTFSAPELLFDWLAEPEIWEKEEFLAAEDSQLRGEVLGLPLYDEAGHRLRYASPAEVGNCVELGRLLIELQQRSEAEGKDFHPTALDKKIKRLADAYGQFRLLTFDPHKLTDTPRRFYARLRLASDAWLKLACDRQAEKRISEDKETRLLMVQTSDVLQQLIAQKDEEDFSLKKIASLAAEFRRVGGQLADRFVDPNDKLLTSLSANLRRESIEMCLALYDNGETLRLTPALSPAALEENRLPGDDASPWLSFQAMMQSPDHWLEGYPLPELQAVRKSFAEAKAAYLDRRAADRPAKFSAAMDRFAQNLRALGEKIEPARQKLPLQHGDQEALDATAYPPPGSLDLEVFYNRLDPFFWSWALGLVATICLLLSVGRLQKPAFWLGALILIAGQLFTASGLLLRMRITGLIPLTGMFETVVFVSLCVAIIGLWLALLPLITLGTSEKVMQRRVFALAGAMVSFLAAVLAYYAPASVMHRSLGSVAPILRDNYWLAVHVVTIMVSYATAAIALILGNIALGYYLFGRYRNRSDGDESRGDSCTNSSPGRRPPEDCSVLAGFIYTILKITVLLLAAGTILGALWADKAWGRFWAWDPKEVWALISLLVYLLILHARHAGWAGDFGMAVAAVLGASAVLFTYYGVNFLISSGMHSYGAGAGGQWQVATAFAIQLIFLAAARVRYTVEKSGMERMRDEG